jgi:hypothetical protein
MRWWIEAATAWRKSQSWRDRIRKSIMQHRRCNGMYPLCGYRMCTRLDAIATSRSTSPWWMNSYIRKSLRCTRMLYIYKVKTYYCICEITFLHETLKQRNSETAFNCNEGLDIGVGSDFTCRAMESNLQENYVDSYFDVALIWLLASLKIYEI